jgi:hypothetical protein
LVPRSALALTVAVALAACAPDTPAPSEPVAPSETSTQIEPSWIASGDGARLTLQARDGGTLLSLACANRIMTAVAPGFDEIGSEERFSLGADDQVFILVAQLGQGGGVRAEGEPAEYFLEHLPRASAVHANYGAQNLGPLIPPSPEQARAFAEACRS